MIDYVDATESKNLSRALLITWWQIFLDSCGDLSEIEKLREAVKFGEKKLVNQTPTIERINTQNYDQRLLQAITVIRYGLGVDLERDTAETKLILSDEKLAKIKRLKR